MYLGPKTLWDCGQSVVVLTFLAGSSLMLNFVIEKSYYSFIQNPDNYEKMQAIKKSENVKNILILNHSEVKLSKFCNYSGDLYIHNRNKLKFSEKQ